jgi:hypothetical protein
LGVIKIQLLTTSIVPNRATANIIKQEWYKYWNYKNANPNNQKIQKIHNPEKVLVELIKYGTKIFTDPLMDKRKEKKVLPVVYIAAYDNIIYAMKKHRIFERFGFNLPKQQKAKGGNSQIAVQYDEWIHNPKQTDWVNVEDADQLLTGHVLTFEVMTILENNINVDLELISSQFSHSIKSP